MAETIKSPLTQSEIAFCDYWKTQVLINKASIEIWKLDHAASLIGIRRTGTCVSCNHNDAKTLNNKYQQLLPAYEKYLSTQLEAADLKKDLEELNEKETNNEVSIEENLEDLKKLNKKYPKRKGIPRKK